MANETREIIVFGGGCFWCTEAVFLQLKGAVAVTSGYAGGWAVNPTYEQVSAGGTGHAEVVRIEYDPDAISFLKLLEVFFSSHDPTTPNRQGADAGEQYRSIILYTTDEQKQEAEAYIEELEKFGAYENSIRTEIKALEAFYPAEERHQQFYERNQDEPYSRIVVAPKIEKVKKDFIPHLK